MSSSARPRASFENFDPEDLRKEFRRLDEQVRAAADPGPELVRKRDWRGMIEVGGNIYMIMKIGAVLGHGLYQIGAQQRGETYEEFLATRNASGAR